jgi:microcin C transport system ATP-binding protein
MVLSRLKAEFKDAYGSLYPRFTIEQIVGEGSAGHRPEVTAAARRQRVAALLAVATVASAAA